MATRRIDDRRPGPAPVIRSDGNTTTFEFEAVSPETGERLVIRCDTQGNVGAWIARGAQSGPSDR
jgi:hypothetical protein